VIESRWSSMSSIANCIVVRPVGRTTLADRRVGMLEWFKSTGKGYQTRMNNVLRAFDEVRRRAGDLPRDPK
jgi:uncharacterized protein (DUF4415 family)